MSTINTAKIPPTMGSAISVSMVLLSASTGGGMSAMAVAVNSAARVCTAPNGCGVALAGPLSGVRVGLRVANGVAVSTPVTVGVMVAVGVLVGVLVTVAGNGRGRP